MRQGERRRRRAPEDDPLTLEPAVVVPMSGEQLQRAAATLAELLLWAWEQEPDQRQAA